VNTDDFVYFNCPPGMNPNDYSVAITSLDTSNPSQPIRTIGGLEQLNVELPHIQLDAYGTIYVLPKSNPNLPTFFARLNRGSTYNIPDVRGQHQRGQKHEMRRHGTLSGGCDESKSAY
jgi:hypothetical protein